MWILVKIRRENSKPRIREMPEGRGDVSHLPKRSEGVHVADPALRGCVGQRFVFQGCDNVTTKSYMSKAETMCIQLILEALVFALEYLIIQAHIFA